MGGVVEIEAAQDPLPRMPQLQSPHLIFYQGKFNTLVENTPYLILLFIAIIY
jgi:hypothetical protein